MNNGHPDYDRYLDYLAEKQAAAQDAYEDFCEELELDPESDEAQERWEEFVDDQARAELELSEALDAQDRFEAEMKEAGW